MNNIEKWRSMKSSSGSHSPSIETIKSIYPDFVLNVDACFLSNPYATSLFFDYVKKDLIDSPDAFFRLLEYYPSQNNILADLVSRSINVDSKNILVCNGAIEGIERIMHSLTGTISVPIPTFSSYYEFAKTNLSVNFYKLDKKKDYVLDLNDYQKFITENKVNNILIINPNNPTGHGLDQDDLRMFLDNNRNVDSIIIDESFFHFNDYKNPNSLSFGMLINSYHNLYIIKSLSKDFGIAGIRLGYVVTNREWVSNTLKFGGLWNVNGLSEYFLKLFSNDSFQIQYEEARIRFLNIHHQFGNDLSKINGIRVLPSRANFYLIEIINGFGDDDLVSDLLFNHGIYLRSCSDKIGLDGNYIRIATRTLEENEFLVDKLRILLN